MPLFLMGFIKETRMLSALKKNRDEFYQEQIKLSPEARREMYKLTMGYVRLGILIGAQSVLIIALGFLVSFMGGKLGWW